MTVRALTGPEKTIVGECNINALTMDPDALAVDAITFGASVSEFKSPVNHRNMPPPVSCIFRSLHLRRIGTTDQLLE